MTDEELAKHWNVSLEKVKSISDFMNSNYALQIGKKKEKNEKVFIYTDHCFDVG